MSRQSIFRSIGVIALVIAALHMFFTYNIEGLREIFSAEIIFLVLFGIILIIQNEKLAYAQLVLSSMDQLFWFLDIFIYIFTKTTPFGAATYLFTGGMPFSLYMVSLANLFIIPILILFILQHGVQMDRWVTGIYFLATVLPIRFISSFFTNPTENFNCAYQDCLLPLIQSDNIALHLFATAFIGLTIILLFYAAWEFFFNKIKNHEEQVGNVIFFTPFVLLAILLIYSAFLPPVACDVDSKVPLDLECIYFEQTENMVYVTLENPTQSNQCTQIRTYVDEATIDLDPGEKVRLELFIPELSPQTYINLDTC